jgi:DNA polymerase
MSDRETLAEVYDAYRADSRFDHLRQDGIVLVPGMGASRPRIFIVGEAPGAVENTTKSPFQGASGRVLRSLLRDVAEMSQDDLFITNTVKYRPPGNRTPTWEEVEASLPYLRREYAAIGYPPVIIAVGGVAWGAFRPDTHRRAGILGVAGTPVQLRAGKALWPMVHPSYALRNVKYQPTMEEHWKRFGDWFREEFG